LSFSPLKTLLNHTPQRFEKEAPTQRAQRRGGMMLLLSFFGPEISVFLAIGVFLHNASKRSSWQKQKRGLFAFLFHLDFFQIRPDLLGCQMPFVVARHLGMGTMVPTRSK
jgi:hypothetical protein